MATEHEFLAVLVEQNKATLAFVEEERNFRRQIHEDLEAAVIQLTRAVDRMQIAIVGDDLGNPGLVARLERIEDRQKTVSVKQEQLGDQWARVRWTALGIGVGAGLGGGGIIAVIMQVIAAGQ